MREDQELDKQDIAVDQENSTFVCLCLHGLICLARLCLTPKHVLLSDLAALAKQHCFLRIAALSASQVVVLTISDIAREPRST